MTVETVLILVLAGLAGGMANAMAGGATLITFPALMAAGLAPIPANASNSVAVVFGNLMGAWAERKLMPPWDMALVVAVVISLLGGVAGAVLLLTTPERVFVMIVPVLIGAATLIFAFSKGVQARVSGWFGGRAEWLRAGLLFPTMVYGGYFGAGLGVIVMSVLGATSAWDLRRTNLMKNFLAVFASAGAIAIFVLQGVVRWPETLVLMASCMTGGFLGGKALAFVPATTMRRAIIAIGCGMTIFYAWKYWA